MTSILQTLFTYDLIVYFTQEIIKKNVFAYLF